MSWFKCHPTHLKNKNNLPYKDQFANILMNNINNLVIFQTTIDSNKKSQVYKKKTKK